MRWSVLVAVAAVAAVPTIVLQTGFVTFSRWRLIVRDSSYRALVRDFHQAFPVAQRVVEGGSAGWDFEVPLPGTDVRARVRARSHMAVVTVKYSDESQDREMYQYQDYSNPVSLRTRGPILLRPLGRDSVRNRSLGSRLRSRRTPRALPRADCAG
jgi:hypothetical protein